MFKLVNAWVYKVLFLVCISVITYGSLVDGNTVNSVNFFKFYGSDKVIHFIMYMSLTFIGLNAMRKHEYRVLLFCIAYGFLIEILQFSNLTNRSFEILDIIANISGAMIGFIAYNRFKK